MERTALLRSLSCSSLACNKFLFSAPKHSRSFLSKSSSVSAATAARYHRRLVPNRSLLHRNSWRSLARASSHSSSLRFGLNNKHFSSLSPRAVASPPTQPSSVLMWFIFSEQDFYNLVDVYLDAVFFPKCIEDFQTFQQEGWHYELNDPSEDITYKGVVFNEMKGVYSQPDNLLGRTAQQAIISSLNGFGNIDGLSALFPDNTYGVDSGGDPLVITKLTFEEFKVCCIYLW
ncbi:hypothetical protein GOBAR_AA21726 [Gossypium barbadense]|uniref:Uncharacterized protein n=1 Tax=Gossypium barbadense TaxID=3634 RepID=A0A2P5X6I6_GOSBA|nr:hypothetical protein GOBAR_AA21726 [Gossypium barbadense]